ncbi:hypothetical protein [Flavobacterium sp. ov086]|uniref:hypothetical protein n=1 Tax=Flavobacterium sp. ov086 TaxID=1761785 RepID=UPI000B73DC0B|nr:hypothetical protein [Flavobacterium sp. ov086]SNR23536.1 natural product precursor [Flavobacterium sp. ov086]
MKKLNPKKLELKNLTIKKLSEEEQEKIKGGYVKGEHSDDSEDMCCNETSSWPIDCS